MWVIRGGAQNRLVDRFVDDGVIGVASDAVPDAEILTHSEIRRHLVADGAGTGVDAEVAMLSAFVREVQPGDSVLLVDPQRGEVVLGEVTGGYEFHGDLAPGLGRHRRAVRWLARHDVADLPAAVQGVAKQRPALRQDRAAEWSGHMARVRDGALGRDPGDRRPVTRRSSPGTPRRPARPRQPAAPATQRTCPSCHLQTHVDRFRGDLCVDCAE